MFVVSPKNSETGFRTNSAGMHLNSTRKELRLLGLQLLGF